MSGACDGCGEPSEEMVVSDDGEFRLCRDCVEALLGVDGARAYG
jgi:formylmethanofuran dehydrogenase subunit E